MKISTVPMALIEGEPPWYHRMVLENGTWVERWVQYEEGDLPEEETEDEPEKVNEPNIIYKSHCPSLIAPWYFCVGCDYRLGLDHVYCPKCGTKLNWDTILEQGK